MRKIRTRITQNTDTFHAVIIMLSNKIECLLSFKFRVCFRFAVRIPSQSFLKDCDLKQKIRSTIMDISIWNKESKEIKQTWTEIKKVGICFEKLWSCCRFNHLVERRLGMSLMSLCFNPMLRISYLLDLFQKSTVS